MWTIGVAAAVESLEPDRLRWPLPAGMVISDVIQ